MSATVVASAPAIALLAVTGAPLLVGTGLVAVTGAPLLAGTGLVVATGALLTAGGGALTGELLASICAGEATGISSG